MNNTCYLCQLYEEAKLANDATLMQLYEPLTCCRCGGTKQQTTVILSGGGWPRPYVRLSFNMRTSTLLSWQGSRVWQNERPIEVTYGTAPCTFCADHKHSRRAKKFVKNQTLR